MPPIVELDRVSYRQQSTDILRAVSWTLQPGERWAVLGANGSGKTTLLRIACGYLWPTSGAVRRMGQELIDLGELRRSIGWVAGDLVAQVPPGELAIETVVSGRFAQVGLRRWGHQRPTDVEFDEASELLDEMGCGSLADKPFGVLSQGERQQTLVARARMVDPLAIVLDEPCAGMDPGVRERFLAWLEELIHRDPRCAMVLVTHHVEEIMPGFGQTLVMHSGEVLAAGATQSVIDSELLTRAYGVTVDRLESASGRLWPIWRT